MYFDSNLIYENLSYIIIFNKMPNINKSGKHGKWLI